MDRLNQAQIARLAMHDYLADRGIDPRYVWSMTDEQAMSQWRQMTPRAAPASGQLGDPVAAAAANPNTIPILVGVTLVSTLAFAGIMAWADRVNEDDVYD